jgi:hypothetical protein
MNPLAPTDGAEMGSTAYERRLGNRHPVAWVEIGWYYRLPSTGPGDPGKIESTIAYLVDISVSGAGVVAPESPHVAIGSIVGFGFRGLQGTVTIRRINTIGHQLESRLYGIEFTEPNSPLAVGLTDVFLARHSQLPKWRDPRYQDEHPAIYAPEPETAAPAPIDASSLGSEWD